MTYTLFYVINQLLQFLQQGKEICGRFNFKRLILNYFNSFCFRNVSLHEVKTANRKDRLKVGTSEFIWHIYLSVIILQSIHDNQKILSSKLADKILRLQEANSIVASSISKAENSTQSNVDEILEAVQDLSNEVLHMVKHCLHFNSFQQRDFKS